MYIQTLLHLDKNLGSNIFSGDNVQYFWYLWRKQKDGKWLDITKKDPKSGLQVTYKFGETFLGTQFKIQVFKATKNGLTKKFEAKLFAELLIVPTSNKIAQIERVVLFNGGASDVNKAHYRDTLTARAYCTAMFNQTVEFHLWEDDAPKGGHNPAINQHNRYNVPFPAKVNEKGITEVQIKLVSHESILKSIANKYVMKGDKNEGKNYEFYVTASYSGKIKNSSQVNVDVANPDYKKDSPKSQPKAPAKKPEQKKTNPQPRPDTYKKPLPNNKPATGKNNQSDKDGRIIDVSFKNRAGKKFTTTPKFGETIIVEILTKNVIGKNYYLRVWEDDTFGKHDLLYEGIHKIDSDQQLVTFALTKGRQQIGEIGNDPKNPDSGEYTMEWKEHQELFAEIAFSDISKESTRLTVDVLEEYKSPEYKKSAAKVKKVEVVKKDDKNKCPRCDEDVTLDQLKKVFPDCSDENKLKQVLSAYNKYMAKFKMNTCWNKAHFFAQTRIESGTSLNFKNESFNYSTRRLIQGDYNSGFVKGNLEKKIPGYHTSGKFNGRPFSYFDNHHDEAEKYGRKDVNKNNDGLIQKANSEVIANFAYGPQSKKGKELKNTTEGDGWLYRGRGFIQLTGRGNYSDSNKYTKLYANVEIMSQSGAEKVGSSPEIAMIACMGYWVADNRIIETKANGEKNEDKISKLIGTDVDWEGKKRAFNEITSKLFKVNECRYAQKEEAKKEIRISMI